MKAKCFCGQPATGRNTVRDKRGLDYSMVYVYSTCDKHWDSTPPELWAPSRQEAWKAAIERGQK